MNTIQFLDQDGTFSIKQPENYSYLYFPVAGEKGIKSSLTPNLGGDTVPLFYQIRRITQSFALPGTQ